MHRSYLTIDANISGPPYDPIFVKKTGQIKELLSLTKLEFDEHDKGINPIQETILFINKKKDRIFATLDEHFSEIWEIVSGMTEFEYRYHQQYYQKELLPLIATPPFNERIYKKPLGYPGDFIMMNYYHEDGYHGDTSYHKLMHRYTLHTPMARVVINRTKFILANILEAARLFKSPLVIGNIGCGPAKELVDLIKTYPDISSNMKFNCLDSEVLALNQIKTDVSEVERSHKTNFNFNCINADITGLIRSVNKYLGGTQSFVYSLGLFDYLKEKTAKRLVEKLYADLDPGGTLIISNFGKNISLRAYMELLGEWYLILRDKEDMKNLASGIKNAKEISVIPEEETKESYYLVIRK